MKPVEIRPGIFHLKYDSQYIVASTFMRLQEFYESAVPGIRGSFFTVEQFMDAHARHFKKFDYFTKWSGFNIRDHVVIKFFELFKYDLLEKEKKLQSAIAELLKRTTPFCIISTYTPDDLVHEIAHGYYYLDNKYAKNMDTIAKESQMANILKKALKREGYREGILNDEVQAYCATGTRSYIRNELNVPDRFRVPKGFKRIFDKKHALKP